jgi:flavorubredoxin
MAPNARSVLAAMKRMAPLFLAMIATGHGPRLRYNLVELTDRDQRWSLEKSQWKTCGGILRGGLWL